MRNIVIAKLEEGRIRSGGMKSSPHDGVMGAFMIMGPKGEQLVIISSGIDQEYGWEHVSVSCRKRTPNWDEMCFVKNLFWTEVEVVMQLHPAKSEYVNCHPNCLHLWRPLDGSIPTPPATLVGPKEKAPC